MRPCELLDMMLLPTSSMVSEKAGMKQGVGALPTASVTRAPLGKVCATWALRSYPMSTKDPLHIEGKRVFKLHMAVQLGRIQ